MIDNYKESDSDKEIARISVLNYIKEAYENNFSDTKINEIFDSIYTSSKTLQELKKDTLKNWIVNLVKEGKWKIVQINSLKMDFYWK